MGFFRPAACFAIFCLGAVSAAGAWTLRNPFSVGGGDFIPLRENTLAYTTVGMVLIRPDKGWQRLTEPMNEANPGSSPYDMHLCADGATGYVLVNAKDVYRTLDDAATWTKVISDPVPGGVSHFGCRAGTLTALSREGYYQAGAGATRWERIMGTPCRSNACQAVPAKGRVFVATSDSLFSTGDSGKTWVPSPSMAMTRWRPLAATTEDLFALSGGRISRFDSISGTFSPVDTALRNVNAIAANGAYFHALVDNEVWRTRDAGIHWETNGVAPKLLPGQEAYGIHVSDSACVIRAAEGAYLMRPFAAAPIRITFGVGSQSNGPIVARGSDLVVYGFSSVYRSGNGGALWETNDIDGGAVTQMQASTKSFFAINGKGLHRSDFGDWTWKPIVSERNYSYPFTMAVSGDTLLHGTSKWMFRSFDNGDHWEADTGRAPTSAGYRLLFDGTHLLAWDSSRVYRSRDMGGTWMSDSTPARFADPMDFSMQAVACQGTLILGKRKDFFRSRDGGASWSRMTVPGKYGFACLAAVGSMLIGSAEDETSPGVYVSADMGTTWYPYAQGLYPQRHYSIASGGATMYLRSGQGAIYAGDVAAIPVALLPSGATRSVRPRDRVKTDILGRSVRPLWRFPVFGW